MQARWAGTVVVTVAMAAISVVGSMAARGQVGYLDKPVWSVLVKAVGEPLPTYSLLEGPIRMRDYVVTNTTTTSLTVTEVRSQCDCVTPFLPKVGTNGAAQELPMTLAPGQAMLLRAAMHVDRFTPGALDDIVEVIGKKGAAPVADLGAFHVRARVTSPVSLRVDPGTGTATTITDLPGEIDAGSLVVAGEWTPVMSVTLNPDPRLSASPAGSDPVALVSDSPRVQVSRTSAPMTYRLSVRTDKPLGAFEETLRIVPSGNRDTLANAFRKMTVHVHGRVDGAFRVSSESVMLALFLHYGPNGAATAAGTLDPQDPARAVITVYGRPHAPAALPPLHLEADPALVIATLSSDTGSADTETDADGWRRIAQIALQIPQPLIDAYRTHGTVPAGAHPLPIPKGGAGDPDRTYAAPALQSRICITAGKDILEIPVTIVIPEKPGEAPRPG